MWESESNLELEFFVLAHVLPERVNGNQPSTCSKRKVDEKHWLAARGDSTCRGNDSCLCSLHH